MTFLILFCLWISYDKLFIFISEKEIRLLKILTILTIFIQLCWSLISGIADIFYNYENSANVAKYIKTNELHKYKIFAGGWSTHYYVDKNNKPIFNKYRIQQIDSTKDKNYKLVQRNIHNMWTAVRIIPYFQKNIFYNFNADQPDKLYSLHRNRPETETQAIIQMWRQKGLPDIIVGDVNLQYIWKDADLYRDYILVKKFYNSYIWKNMVIFDYNSQLCIYMRKELFKKLNFKQDLEQGN